MQSDNSSFNSRRRSLRLARRETDGSSGHNTGSSHLQLDGSSSNGKWTWMDFADPIWRKQFLDLGHCRLKKCTERLSQATAAQLEDISNKRITFMAMAISAAASSSSMHSSCTAKSKKDLLLTKYCKVLVDRCGMDPNDTYKGSSAVTLAARHGFTGVLSALLAAGSSLGEHGGVCATGTESVAASTDHIGRSTSGTGIDHALRAAVRSGNHVSLELMLLKRPEESTAILKQDALETKRVSTLLLAIIKGDLLSVRLLTKHGNAMISDLDAKYMSSNRTFQKRLESAINDTCHHDNDPIMIDSSHFSSSPPAASYWCKCHHWSFPTTDRQTLNFLWHAVVKSCHRSSSSSAVITEERKHLPHLPDEIWLRIFSFIGRGWWASQRFNVVGRDAADVVSSNIV